MPLPQRQFPFKSTWHYDCLCMHRCRLQAARQAGCLLVVSHYCRNSGKPFAVSIWAAHNGLHGPPQNLNGHGRCKYLLRRSQNVPRHGMFCVHEDSSCMSPGKGSSQNICALDPLLHSIGCYCCKATDMTRLHCTKYNISVSTFEHS